MDETEDVVYNGVIYTVTRKFVGQKNVKEILLDRLVSQQNLKIPLDLGTDSVV